MVYMLELVAEHFGDASCFRKIATFYFVIFISDKSCIAVKIQQKIIVMTALLIL
jgi:hypothetical protein